ncbi:MAG: hypothetical protein EKK37_01690 [Sphingobacteriales bacterium]|nr:MAG: hypothetical protein EKK37_01690 [Sphingobacteriales bacterium]
MKRKLAAILFLFVLISSNSELHQLLKIPALISHFIEHKKADHSISFIAFLKLHYKETREIDKDHDRDMQLPFKADNCSFLTLTLYQHKTSIELNNKEQMISKQHLSVDDQFVSSQVLNSIWQPPRLA